MTADTTKENTVDHRYVCRLLIELRSYLPIDQFTAAMPMESLQLLCLPPAQALRQQAERLQRQADRLERAEQLRREVEQAIAWLDSAGAGAPAVGIEGSEAVAPELTEGGE